MKIKNILILVCLLTANTLYGQNTPQLSFYGSSDLSTLLEGATNDVNVYENILSALSGGIDEKQNLELYYKLYIIQHTSELHYTMKDGSKLYFKCTDPNEKEDDYMYFKLGDDVDFGTPLVKVDQTKEGVNRMRFESKVTQIDPAIFQDGVTEIKLPYNEGMHYQSSKSISVRDLISIKGKDVIDNTLLVDNTKTLIAGAFASKEEYVFPDGVETVGVGAMRHCTLRKVVFPTSLNRIGSFALEDCPNLVQLALPSPSVVEISENAFGLDFPTALTIKVPKKLVKQYKARYVQIKKQFKSL